MVPPSSGRELEAESTSVVIEAPEFPDFDHSEMEAAEDEAVDIGALDLEALNLVCAQAGVPDQCEPTDFPHSLPPSSFCEPVEPLMSSNINESHLEPASLPEPMNISGFLEPSVSELWSQSEEVSLDPQFNPHPDEAERGAADDITQPASDSHPRCVFKTPVTHKPSVCSLIDSLSPKVYSITAVTVRQEITCTRMWKTSKNPSLNRTRVNVKLA